MTESPQQPGSTCLAETVDSAQSDALLALGRKIVEELGFETERDTLGRWMSHHLAAMITTAANATGSEKAVADNACFEAILALWEHRSELPNGARPFKNLEPVIRAMEELDPESGIFRYYRGRRPSENEQSENAEQEKWLRTADALDYSAKVLISFCLQRAAGAGIDNAKEWVRLAREAGLDDGPPEMIIHFISSPKDLDNETDLKGHVRALLEDRLKRIRGMLTVAEQYAAVVEAELAELPALKEEGDTKTMRISPARPTFD